MNPDQAPVPGMGNFEWLMLVGLSVLWGGSFFFAKIAVTEMSPFSLVFYRVAIAAVILLVYIKLSRGALPRGRQIWLTFFAMGLLNNAIPFSLLFWGQIHIASGLASILNATTPIFTMLIANLALQDERLTSGKLVGVFFGFVGVAVMLGFTGLDRELTSLHGLAMLACLGAALSYGFAGVFGRRFAKSGVAPLHVAFGQLAASSILMIPVVVVSGAGFNLFSLSLSILGSVVVLAVACTAFAYILFFRILATGGAVNISMVTLLVPVSAILLGALFLNEQLAWNAYVGMALIGSGLVAIDGRLFKRQTVT